MSQKDAVTPQARAKHPRTPLAGPYGHPLHPLVVTIPIGTWVASFIFDLAAMFTRDEEVFSRGAVWLIGIGIIGALLAALFGLIDLSGLASGTRAQRTALIHMAINLTVVVLFIVGFIVRINHGYESVNAAAFILSIVALLMLSVSGWLGGRLAYRYGVRVADEQTQSEGFRATP